MILLNCWEFLKCGRELGGIKEKELGTCPAATSVQYDGTNRGTAAGRFCWIIEGTLCPGNVVSKFKTCINCTFYKLVMDQEKDLFQLTPKFFP